MTELRSTALQRFMPPGLRDEYLPPREPELCAVCGRGLSSGKEHGLCSMCERSAALKLRALLRALEPEELGYLDWSVEGVSLADFAAAEM